MLLKHFKDIQLHDQPVDCIQYDFNSKSVKIEISYNNEEKSYYDKLEMIFLNVEHLESEKILLSKFHSIEINSCDIFEEKDKFLIKFLFLVDSEMPSFELVIKFSHCKILLNGSYIGGNDPN